MFFWFIGCSVLIVAWVFASPAIDYRLVALGSVLPIIELVLGGPWLLHTLLAPVAVMTLVMIVLAGQTAAAAPVAGDTDRYVPLPRRSTGRGPAPSCSGGPHSARRSTTPICPRGMLSAWSLLKEAIGLAALAFTVRRYGLADPAARRDLVRTRAPASGLDVGTTPDMLITPRFAMVEPSPTPADCSRAASTIRSTTSVTARPDAAAAMIGAVDVVITSPLRRAAETAAAFTAHDVRTDQPLARARLRRLGRPPGRRRARRTSGDGGVADLSFRPPGGESLDELGVTDTRAPSTSSPPTRPATMWSSSPTSRRSRPRSPGRSGWVTRSGGGRTSTRDRSPRCASTGVAR